MTESVSISNLIQDLTTRSGRAILSQLGLRSATLRKYLGSLYGREPGEPGALLADPVLEAAFGWKLADVDMQGLSRGGLLREELVSAMDKPPREYRGEYAFPRRRKPFQHQLDCWRLLLDDLPRSVLVASGTGSGKTECFLVPILEDLARERARTGPLTGVRALFLYPLNALINSQRDRLRAWCNGFGSDVRFCLYNGETPETAPAHEQARAGAEQISRGALRTGAAPVLVTNSTMLEYMLIRTEDQPILEQSRGADPEHDDRLLEGLNRLIRGTALVTGATAHLLDFTAVAMARSMDAWRREVDALRKDAERFRGGELEPRAPAVLAIERQLRRLEGEYLLAEPANRQFLPGYGFPNGIVSFVPTTIDELKRRRADREGREEALGKRSGYPSRQMEMAIREYAPGAEIVMDGRVYESGGVTLNWHIPPGVESLNEVQALRHVWRCRQCGVTGDAPARPERCPHCDGSLETRKYLEPAGFAVDIRHSPHNNVVSPRYIPVEPPWISCPTPEWASFADPRIGRFRYTDSGHLFHGSRGLSGHGYAICLRCGRAASEAGSALETGLPDAFKEGHSRLRGGKDPDGNSRCDGAGFAIQRELSLGGSRTTDVFELQLAGLNDVGTALSIAIALRRTFCQRLGIEEEEVGVTVRQGKADDDTIQQSIFLYDAATGGNGYVAALHHHVGPALRESVRILDCVKKCDAACHGCLLTWDTQYDSAKLDRHAACDFLSDEILAGLDLHERHRILGSDSRVLTRPLTRHLAEVAMEPGVEEIRIWIGGDPDSWDVEDFPLYRDILRWVDDARLVRLFVAPSTWSRLGEGDRHSLASLVTTGRGHVEVHQMPARLTESGSGAVLATAGGSQQHFRWAVSKVTAAPMNDAWGLPPKEGQAIYARIENALPPIQSDAITADQLRPQHDEAVAILSIQKELDGRIEGFGSRFWSHVQECCRPLKAQFEQGTLLTAVSYSDRYIATPWALLLLREVLLDLVREKRSNARTALRLLTRSLRRDLRPSRFGRSVSDQWQDDAARQSFFTQAFGIGRSRLRWKGPLEFESGPAPHFRELRLEWENGAAWSLKLDQGVGYWRCRPSSDFPFDKNLGEQLQAINEMSKRCRAVSQGSHPTFVYVSEG